MFELHPQLVKDCFIVGDLPLSQILLPNDSHYPWVILVPRRNGVREIFQLEREDQSQLLLESSQLAAAMSDCFHADKMNVAALGNVVPQLHLHIVARYQTDPSWPSPVWGAAPAKPFSDEELQIRLQELQSIFAAFLVTTQPISICGAE